MENVINNAEANKITEERPPVQVVKSLRIAESLCTDYPFFRDLLGAQKDRLNGERRVWFFRRSEEFDKVFQQLVDEATERNFKKNTENKGE